jgi:hypothetical protein
VESNAFQVVLIYLFEYWCRKFRYEGIVWKELYNKNKKLERMRGWCGMLHSGETALNEDDYELVECLTDIKVDRKNNDDDLPDCCSFSVQMINSHLSEIIENRQPDRVREYQHFDNSMYALSPV